MNSEALNSGWRLSRRNAIIVGGGLVASWWIGRWLSRFVDIQEPQLPSGLESLRSLPQSKIPESQLESQEGGFGTLFDRISQIQIVRPDANEVPLIYSSLELVKKFVLSPQAFELRYAHRNDETIGALRAVVIDSRDGGLSGALSADLQGGGEHLPGLLKRYDLVSAIMLDRRAKEAVLIGYFDNPSFSYLSGRATSIPETHITYWDAGGAIGFPAVGSEEEATFEDLKMFVGLLEDGQVNVELTKRCEAELYRRFDTGYEVYA